MAGNKYDNNSRSLSYYAWQRMKKNKLAMFGLFVIGFCFLIAVADYFIIPDGTSDADTQILEIANKPPGFTVQLIMNRKNQEEHHTGFFDRMWEGEPSEYKAQPIVEKPEFIANNIVVETYTGRKPNNGIKMKLNLADLLYPINTQKPFVEDTLHGTMDFYVYGSNEKMHKTVVELRAEVEKNCIVNRKYFLGTDNLGRDMLSRLMLGTRISLSVGFVSVLISVLIGIFLGALAGYFRGWVDDLIMWMINVVWSIPTLLLVIAITLALGKGLVQVFIAVGLTMWVDTARVVRGQALSIREKEFVEAGRALGYTNFRIIFRHLLPNVMGPVIVISAANFANAIIIEAGLSYLGIGAQPPTASWGAMISEHRQYIFSDSAYLAVVPGLAIMFIVLAFMLVGNGLRDALDAKAIEEEQVMGY